jgi:metallo-beta-lactamase family protein
MAITITFHGAARTVTGSQHLVSVNGFRILLDCGFYQGSRTDTMQRNQNLPFDAAAVDVMVLSHAHIDHSANIPNLVKSGYSGDIICTAATRDLCTLMLRDSAKIQESDSCPRLNPSTRCRMPSPACRTSSASITSGRFAWRRASA